MIETLESFWESIARAAGRALQTAQIASRPSAVRKYLEHAIALGTPLACAVRLRMRGETKLKRWLPFIAEQVIRRDRGMI